VTTPGSDQPEHPDVTWTVAPTAVRPASISRYTLAPTAFRAKSRGGPVTTSGGMRITYTLSGRAATVFFTVQKKGRTGWLSFGYFSQHAHVGANRVRFSGRLSPGLQLPPGAYRLSAQADNSTRQLYKSFRILK
jgi:hypothetical protein